ncbi:MAG TPA: copper homeostasis membrane protein CopD [Xanthobacteraceae bacterium]
MDDPLIWARAIHFGATMMVSGGVFFLVFIAEPAFRAASDLLLAARVRARLAMLAWISLAVAILSGAAWLVLQAQRMGEQSVAEVFTQGTAWTVLSDTDFGHDWAARLVLAALLAAILPLLHRLRVAAVTVAAGLAGSLAWAGHAAASLGTPGVIHLAADILHLVAAAAWFGALIPLAVLLLSARRVPAETSLTVARAAVLRFSPLGVASVGTLVATGAVNTFMLAGSVPALVGTDYGRLLDVKVALFLVMLSFGAINRLWLSPRIVQTSPAAAAVALRQIERNSLIEAGLGTIIIVIVGLLGTLPPGLAAD